LQVRLFLKEFPKIWGKNYNARPLKLYSLQNFQGPSMLNLVNQCKNTYTLHWSNIESQCIKKWKFVLLKFMYKLFFILKKKNKKFLIFELEPGVCVDATVVLNLFSSRYTLTSETNFVAHLRTYFLCKILLLYKLKPKLQLS